LIKILSASIKLSSSGGGYQPNCFWKGRPGLVSAFDGGVAKQGANQCEDAVDETLGWGEVGLHVDDQEGLALGLLRAGRSDGG
jgi:hypothetical protein